MLPLLTLAIFISQVNSNDLIFSDVSSTHPNSEAVNYLKSLGVLEGYSDGTYKPEAKINRAEFTKIVLESTLDSKEISGSDCFPDVANQWFANPICTAKSLGLIDGFPDGYFKPEQNITLAEASKIIVNSFGYETASSEVWYERYINKLSSLNSIPKSIDALSDYITRGEMAEMIMRLKLEILSKPSQSLQSLEANVLQNENTVVRNLSADVWADNWFALYDSNGLIKEDSVSINTERSFNAESFNFTTQANVLSFVLKDYKANDTGLEYIGTNRQQMGDGGFIMQIEDQKTGDIVAVSDNSMKCLTIHTAPLNKQCERDSNPISG